MAKITCAKCGRTKEDTMFYTDSHGQKAELCKDCMLMHVNVWDPETFVWLLEKMDVPWLPWEWNNLREKAYAKNPKKKNDTTVFGKYLSLMKLKQHKNQRWADTEKLQKEHELETAANTAAVRQMQEQAQRRYENGQISQAEYRTLVDVQDQVKADRAAPAASLDPSEQDTIGYSAYNQKNFMSQDQIPDLAQDLTEEDKKYLVMKWGRLYTPQEWIQLETFYNQMTNSFDIQDADTRSTLILICKNNLKMNQAIDQGDLEGYQKLARVSDTLRKSAKFTAAQNKDQKSEFVDSIGQLVAYCQEKGGEIPQFKMQAPQDIVDKVIADLKEYNKSLIYEDTALARQIEDYLKKRAFIEQSKQDLAEAKLRGLSNVEITDLDIQEYNKEIQNQKEQDSLVYAEEGYDEPLEPLDDQ